AVAPLREADRRFLESGLLQAAAPCQAPHQLEVAALPGIGEGDGKAEAVGERELLVLAVPAVDIVVERVRAVTEALLEQVPAVAGGVQRDVVRPAREAA